MWRLFRQIASNPDVAPVFIITSLGATMGVCAIFNACLKYPDVSFKRKSNPHPWVHVKPDQQVKLLAFHDYNRMQSKRPHYDED